MATDSFTNSDGTALSTHDAAWTKGNGYTGSVTIQSNQARGPDFANCCYYYSGSGQTSSEIVKKAYSALGNNRFAVTVRTSNSTLGYNLRLRGLSGDNFTEAAVYKNTTYVASSTGITVSRLSDITMKITATTNGSDQDIRIWINGVQLTFGYSGAGTTYSGQVLTDPSANTPITGGDPGFFNNSSAAQAENYWDDWTDGAAAGVEAKPTVYGVDFGHSLCPDHLYMMDEGTGSTLTDKGKTGGLNLAITGADWTTDPTHGNVLDFVGANTDYAQVAVSGLTGTHTLCALVYASAGSVQRTIASFCDSGDFDRYVALVYQADEDLEAISRFDATAVTNTSTTDIPADTWSLVFMRFSDTTIDWSLNGSAWTTQAVSHSGLVAAINRFTVGYRNTSSPGNPWDDQMAALMWWRSSLSDANIASIAADPWQYLTPGGAHKLIGKFGGKLRGKI